MSTPQPQPLALDEWARASLQDMLAPGAAFAWDGGCRVLIGWVSPTSDRGLRPACVVRFAPRVVDVLAHAKPPANARLRERCRALVRSRLGAQPWNGSTPLIVDLDEADPLTSLN
ncbi:hypothetical protein VARIO8X_50056 [Burkholderiales bacterium 8X]|nr:hypothetical protein VARIO8X_50056 [Burkholderiales bacterium 8X]